MLLLTMVKLTADVVCVLVSCRFDCSVSDMTSYGLLNCSKTILHSTLVAGVSRCESLAYRGP